MPFCFMPPIRRERWLDRLVLLCLGFVHIGFVKGSSACGRTGGWWSVIKVLSFPRLVSSAIARSHQIRPFPPIPVFPVVEESPCVFVSVHRQLQRFLLTKVTPATKEAIRTCMLANIQSWVGGGAGAKGKGRIAGIAGAKFRGAFSLEIYTGND